MVSGVGLGDVGGELSQGLTHQPGLQSHLLVSHLTLNFRLRSQGGHGVHHDDVYSPAADQVIGYLEGLLPVVGLGYEEGVHVHSEILRVGAVKGVLRIDNGRR